ncbi:MAG TPA: MFS transporter [Blastocatellia bacterium]|jgi:ACS family hexuronate transporter-like MFS transporter|nr:MFS transporter [Blastocatellia bacterium]
MAAAIEDTKRTRPIKHLRWYIGGALFLSTVINYLDRQTLSVLAPYIKDEYRWTNTDFAMLIIAFRVAYAFGQTASGRFLDWVGTRKGLSLTVAFYSVAAMTTSLAVGLRSFAFFRFLLGAGESANWPGATKAVSEWFPKRESGWAVALFDSGSSIGGAIAPFLVLWVYHTFGSWRPAFIVTGALGFIWLLLFRKLYRRPEEHPRLSADEREYILKARADAGANEGGRRLSYRTLLRLPQTWGIIIAKTLTDPVWFFITDWFAIYLVTKGFKLEESLLAFWVPFLAADVGNFAGGGFSSWLIKRGWSVGAARKLVIVVCGLGMTLLIPTVYTASYFWLVACFALSTLAYAALSTMVLNLPADIYPTGSVASVSGMSGTGAGIGTITATYLTGVVADRYSFEPILIAASLIPLLAVVAALALVRNNRATQEGVVNPI